MRIKVVQDLGLPPVVGCNEGTEIQSKAFGLTAEVPQPTRRCGAVARRVKDLFEPETDPVQLLQARDLLEYPLSAHLARILCRNLLRRMRYRCQFARRVPKIGCAQAIWLQQVVEMCGKRHRVVASRSRANSWPEEPDALIGHVRLRGGPGWATTLGYPTAVV